MAKVTDNDYFPRLAGQAGRLSVQPAAEFPRRGARKYPPMNYLVTYLSDDYLHQIATYFSQQRPPYPSPAKPTVSSSTLGARPADRAETATPRSRFRLARLATARVLTGMEPAIPGVWSVCHSDYISAPARRIGARARAMPIAPDCMHTIATRLTDDDVNAVASWLSTQQAPQKPRAGSGPLDEDSALPAAANRNKATGRDTQMKRKSLFALSAVVVVAAAALVPVLWSGGDHLHNGTAMAANGPPTRPR